MYLDLSISHKDFATREAIPRVFLWCFFYYYVYYYLLKETHTFEPDEQIKIEIESNTGKKTKEIITQII